MAEDLKIKLEKINKKLAEVTAERKKLSPLKLKKYKKNHKNNQNNQKKLINKPLQNYSTSHLESIITEISLSPYLTKPDEKYSKKTIQLPSIIRDLREKDSLSSSLSSSTLSTTTTNNNNNNNTNSSVLHGTTTSLMSINEEEMNQFKKTFNDVLNYKLHYNPPLRKKQQLPSLNPISSSSSTSSSSSSSQLKVSSAPSLSNSQNNENSTQ